MKVVPDALAAVVLLLGANLVACNQHRSAPERSSPVVTNPIEERLRPSASIPRQEGLAVAILVDTSGSMKDSVSDVDGKQKAKMQIAQRSVLDLLGQLQDFARKNPERRILVGIYEFSSRDEVPSSRPVIEMGPPDVARTEAAMKEIVPSGGTPIGNAMIEAKRSLDATGLTRRHMLVVTDGENNRGYTPGDVAAVIARQTDEERASIYFIAFDIEAGVFNAVRNAGGLVLAARNEGNLRQTLDFVLTGKILAEEPVSPARK